MFFLLGKYIFGYKSPINLLLARYTIILIHSSAMQKKDRPELLAVLCFTTISNREKTALKPKKYREETALRPKKNRKKTLKKLLTDIIKNHL